MNGENGTPVKQWELGYQTSAALAGGETVSLVNSRSVFKDGTDATKITTASNYTFSGLHATQVVTTLPTITAAQNGPATVVYSNLATGTISTASAAGTVIKALSVAETDLG